ncbi:MAG: sialidase family protein [Anaerolineae bacterium]|nr:sialidase family protein [Anaerolineae bacterium]
MRRRSDAFIGCWIECFQSTDNGRQWSFLSWVGETGGHNGNPPALVRMADGRLCCVYGNRDRAVMIARFSADGGLMWGLELLLRDDFESVNGFRDLGYPRLFQRPDGKLVTAYFWCSPGKPETHVAATIFEAP